MFPHNNVRLPYLNSHNYSSDLPPSQNTIPPPAFGGGGGGGGGGSPSFIETRIIGIHSRDKNSGVYFPISKSSSPPDYIDPITTPTRNSQVTNLAQQNHRANRAVVNESSVLECLSKASPYGPEEKKERIERYRTKRNLRNFNKKIEYECRKTLANSRLRVKGRFKRNEEIEKVPQSDWDNYLVVEDDSDWIAFLDPFPNEIMP
ncbi:zinc finger protein CONSTANS-LIKE 5-like [Andrographis paniculata]|uniref:zinc finger protein CONSTANS-LIKE 5-like n=1 Tax=Andrographis paniculata TaxID=175694 RepID=UPI0021E90A15|nr:zinc finger protein CONSTANS-LIKE 5-like [Andrographis paniculata]